MRVAARRVGAIELEEEGLLEGVVLGGAVGLGEAVAGEEPVGCQADGGVEDLVRAGGVVEEGGGEAWEGGGGGEGGEVEGGDEVWGARADCVGGDCVKVAGEG